MGGDEAMNGHKRGGACRGISGTAREAGNARRSHIG